MPSFKTKLNAFKDKFFRRKRKVEVISSRAGVFDPAGIYTQNSANNSSSPQVILQPRPTTTETITIPNYTIPNYTIQHPKPPTGQPLTQSIPRPNISPSPLRQESPSIQRPNVPSPSNIGWRTLPASDSSTVSEKSPPVVQPKPIRPATVNTTLNSSTGPNLFANVPSPGDALRSTFGGGFFGSSQATRPNPEPTQTDPKPTLPSLQPSRQSQIGPQFLKQSQQPSLQSHISPQPFRQPQIDPQPPQQSQQPSLHSQISPQPFRQSQIDPKLPSKSQTLQPSAERSHISPQFKPIIPSPSRLPSSTQPFAPQQPPTSSKQTEKLSGFISELIQAKNPDRAKDAIKNIISESGWNFKLCENQSLGYVSEWSAPNQQGVHAVRELEKATPEIDYMIFIAEGERHKNDDNYFFERIRLN